MYRLLEEGEVILSTDEYYSILQHKWSTVGKSVIKTNLKVIPGNLPIRRKIPTSLEPLFLK